MKHLIFACRRDSTTDPEPHFSAAMNGLSSLLRAEGSVERCIISQAASVRPGDDALRRAAVFDTVIELWAPARNGVMAALREQGVLTNVDGFEVEELIEKSAAETHEAVNLSGVSWWAPLVAPKAVPAATLRRRYDAHVPLALRIHRAADRYVRHWVTRALGPLRRPYFGVTLLHFPLDSDFREHHYDSPDGQAAIGEDVRHFVDLMQITPIAARAYSLL